MTPEEFKLEMMALTEPVTAEKPPHWSYWRHDLWHRAQRDHADNFWNWPCIYATMLVEHFPLGEQLALLQTDWARWERPLSHLENDKHYRNMVNQAFCVKQWEDATGRHLEDLSSIYEFGGGYGALAHLAARLGFDGVYRIQDLPEFTVLQRWWLAQHGLTVEHVTAPVESDLAVCLYSLSETPADYRQQIGAALAAQSYLMLYSGQWAQHDNHAWIRDFIAMRGDKTWTLSQYLKRPDWFAIGR